ncbi:MAG: TIGR02221 family CRISPR-associated protein [Chloroflexales bacterium]
MTTTLISFLGAGNYTETTYVFGDDRHATCYMTEAAAHFFRPDRLLVIVTVQARDKHLDALCARVGDALTPVPVLIPSGQSEAEQWAMFTRIAEEIAPGDEIIFDITNGFRSIPVIALLVAAYVRVVRHATVRHLIYGAFDAKNAQNETPVFDLTPLVSLLDWTTATEAFLRYGRADALRDLVSSSASLDKSGPSAAHQLSARLGDLTSALQTSRPAEVMQTAIGLPADLAAFRAAQQPGAHGNEPLSLLLTTIEGEYARIGHARPHDRTLGGEVLIKQLEMIEWYAQKQLYIQAFTLTREWLISVVLAEGNLDLYGEDERWLAEAAINRYPTTNQRPPRAVPLDLQQAGKQPVLQQLWARCRRLRNDLAHAGMSGGAKRALDVEHEVRAVCAQLRPALRSLGYPV